jgi:hypothetical protein
MTETNTRQPPTPTEVQERLNRMYGATVPGAAAKVDENNATQVMKVLVGTSLTVPEQASVFQQYADAASPRNIVGKLLKFAKGDYIAGEGGEEIPEGTKLIAVMDELWTGWTRWENNKPVESRIGRVIDKFVPAKRRALGDENRDEWAVDDRGEPRDPWQFGNYLVLKSPETGEFFTFTTGTRGGINAIAELCRHYARDVKQHPDYFPIIALKSNSYNHPNKAFGRIKIPVFTVVGRSPRDGSVAVQAVADDMNDDLPF